MENTGLFKNKKERFTEYNFSKLKEKKITSPINLLLIGNANKTVTNTCFSGQSKYLPLLEKYTESPQNWYSTQVQEVFRWIQMESSHCAYLVPKAVWTQPFFVNARRAPFAPELLSQVHLTKIVKWKFPKQKFLLHRRMYKTASHASSCLRFQLTTTIM